MLYRVRSGGMAYLFSLSTFSLACYGGVSTVSAHLIAAAIASLCIFYSAYRHRGKSAAQAKVSFTFLTSMFVAFVSAAAIQGAIFYNLHGTPHKLAGINVYAAFAIAGLGSVFILSLMTEKYVSPRLENYDNKDEAQAVATILILVTIVIRLMYLGLPELMEQEAYYWNYAQHPALSYLDHPPLVAVLIWIGTGLCGLSEFGVRIGAFVCWLITAFFTYRLTFRLFGKPAAVGAVLLLAVLPLYFGVGFLMTPDAPLHAAWSALIYFLYRAVIDGSSRAWFGVGVSLGMGLLSKYTIVLLCPAVLCFLLIDRNARRWLVRPEPYMALVLAFVIFSPVILWNFQHEWASFLFQTDKRLSAKTVYTTHVLFGHITLILTPVGLLAVLMFLLTGNRIFKEADEPGQGAKKTGIDRKYLLYLLLTLVPFLVFLTMSLSKEVKLNWTSPIWLALLPFLGFTTASVYEKFCSSCFRVMQKLWRITIAVLTCAFAVGLHYVTLGLPGVPPPPGPFLIGWHELARDVEQLVEALERSSGKRIIAVGMDHYQITSGLAYYRTEVKTRNKTEQGAKPIDETTGWQVFGFNARMYSYWSDPATYQGADFLAIASQKSRLESTFFRTDVDFKTDIQPLDATKDGQVVRQFYYRLISLPSAD